MPSKICSTVKSLKFEDSYSRKEKFLLESKKTKKNPTNKQNPSPRKQHPLPPDIIKKSLGFFWFKNRNR